jgi:hypothetical protein
MVRGWLGETPTVVVCLDVTELTEPELRQDVLKLPRRVRKLTALLRLALALLQTSGFRLTVARLPDGRDKLRILRAVDRARASHCERSCGSCMSRRVGFMLVAAGSACVLDDQSCCPPYPRLD